MKHDIEMSANYGFTISEALEQAETELVELNETIESIKRLTPECDKLDYVLAASSGALCGMIDIFGVGKPGESPLGKVVDGWMAGKIMLFARLFHPDKKDFNSLEEAIRFLENKFKIPYDQTGIGEAGREVFDLTPKNHHFKSLGHNPSLLGLFFSILDQFWNTSHFVSDGQVIVLEQADTKWELRGKTVCAKLFCGFVNWLGHLMSDAAGSQSSARAGNRGMGVPSPLWTWTNDIIVIKRKLGLSVTETDKSLNALAQKIFEKGYDARFQVTQAIPVILNDLIVRFMYASRRLFRYFAETPKEERSFQLLWTRCEPFSNVTVQRMLTVAHGTFVLIDAGDAVIRGFIEGGGSFNPIEFVLRLNVVGIGRFSISLYREVKLAILYTHKKHEVAFAESEKRILEDYIKGLKILAKKYDDAHLLTFVKDFEQGDIYKGFEKTIKLAELRGVPKEKILRTPQDIAKYFGANSEESAAAPGRAHEEIAGYFGANSLDVRSAQHVVKICLTA